MPTHDSQEPLVETAAKAIGSAIGKIAAKTGLAHADAPGTEAAPLLRAPEKKTGKFEPKHKERLPRRLKKAQKKSVMEM